MKQEIERLKSHLIDVIKAAIPKVKASHRLLSQKLVNEEARNRFANAVANGTTWTEVGFSNEESYLTERISKIERELDRGRVPSRDDLPVLMDVRQQLLRELTLRKLQAQGVTLSESARTPAAPDPSAPAVADKLDRILRELSALRAEVRDAAGVKK